MQASKTEKGIRLLLESIGENTNRTGLLETPARTARMYEEIFGGYNANVREILSKRFPVNENPDENPGDSQSANSDIACDAGIVLEKNITFYSMCEHHMLPFYGHAHIAYIPRNEVVGISKLARLTEAFARRLQIQEQLTGQILQSLDEHLQPRGTMVVIEAEHMCMTMRGIKKPGSRTVTVRASGLFIENNDLKTQVWEMLKA